MHLVQLEKHSIFPQNYEIAGIQLRRVMAPPHRQTLAVVGITIVIASSTKPSEITVS